jgi:hypothetical protein
LAETLAYKTDEKEKCSSAPGKFLGRNSLKLLEAHRSDAEMFQDVSILGLRPSQEPARSRTRLFKTGHRWVKSEWRITDSKQRAKFYTITALGKKQLLSDHEQWQTLARAIGAIMDPEKEQT